MLEKNKTSIKTHHKIIQWITSKTMKKENCIRRILLYFRTRMYSYESNTCKIYERNSGNTGKIEMPSQFNDWKKTTCKNYCCCGSLRITTMRQVCPNSEIKNKNHDCPMNMTNGKIKKITHPKRPKVPIYLNPKVNNELEKLIDDGNIEDFQVDQTNITYRHIT